MKIGDRIKQEREARGLDRRQVRTLTGISVSYLHEVEANVFSPSPERLKKIADCFGMTVPQLEDGIE